MIKTGASKENSRAMTTFLHIAAGETAHGNIQAGSPDVILPEQPAGVILGGLFPQVEAKTG